LKQNPKVPPVQVEEPAPPVVTRLSQEELKQLFTVARKNYENWQNYGGDGLAQLLGLLLFDLLDATQQQNQLLTRIADALQPGQK